MHLFAVSLRHPNSPINIRERFAILNQQQAYQYFNSIDIKAFILSTCNRSEIYCELAHKDVQIILTWWANFLDEDVETLKKYAQIYFDQEAVKHLFEVCCGIDSMVIGENQITSQIKQAYKIAKHNNNFSSRLHKIIQSAFACAKNVRSNTDISKYSISFAIAGLSLARKIFIDLAQTNILLIGAGEMMHTLAPHFSAQNPNKITIANRNQNNAQNMVKQRLQNYNGNINIVNIENITNILHEYDIVVSCLAYPKIIINYNLIQSCLKKRKFKSMCLIDLSVPLVMDGDISKINDVFLYNVDSLSKIVEQGKSRRQQAKNEARVIINNELHKYEEWQKKQLHLPLIEKINLNSQQQLENIKKIILKLNLENENYSHVKSDELNKLLATMNKKNMHDWFYILSILNHQQIEQIEEYFFNINKNQIESVN